MVSDLEKPQHPGVLSCSNSRNGFTGETHLASDSKSDYNMTQKDGECMKYKIAICDDDAQQREYVQEIVTAWAKKNRHLDKVYPIQCRSQTLLV